MTTKKVTLKSALKSVLKSALKAKAPPKAKAAKAVAKPFHGGAALRPAAPKSIMNAVDPGSIAKTVKSIKRTK